MVASTSRGPWLVLSLAANLVLVLVLVLARFSPKATRNSLRSEPAPSRLWSTLLSGAESTEYPRCSVRQRGNRAAVAFCARVESNLECADREQRCHQCGRCIDPSVSPPPPSSVGQSGRPLPSMALVTFWDGTMQYECALVL